MTGFDKSFDLFRHVATIFYKCWRVLTDVDQVLLSLDILWLIMVHSDKCYQVEQVLKTYSKTCLLELTSFDWFQPRFDRFY